MNDLVVVVLDDKDPSVSLDEMKYAYNHHHWTI